MKTLFIHIMHLINVSISSEDWEAIKDYGTLLLSGITMLLAAISPIATLLLPPLTVMLVLVRIYHYWKKPSKK